KPTDVNVSHVDGALYYVARGAGQVRKVFSTSHPAPVIADQPANLTVPVGEPASFTVAASGSGTLAYQWQRNHANISGAISPTFTVASASLSDNAAQFRCVVSNSSGSAASNDAVLTVLNDHRPVPVISTPTDSARYTAGDVVNFSGSATDAEDGNEPASRMTWEVRFFHN